MVAMFVWMAVVALVKALVLSGMYAMVFVPVFWFLQKDFRRRYKQLEDRLAELHRQCSTATRQLH
jgi:hypothetical protein